MAKKCNEAALSLLVCMEKTDCVLGKKRSLEECMRDPIESDPCLSVRNAYYNCKHSQLNMRTRIRGIGVARGRGGVVGGNSIGTGGGSPGY
ncbi:hypothetical protein ACHAXA_000442 [Cyclostephanos tholiformis]|uniref:Cytochrome c oxidase assembly factor 5 n=1 Tax=Cyclostephanos tholiformis TaxID=382380 RepID=A0ABD3RVW5_9STRA